MKLRLSSAALAAAGTYLLDPTLLEEDGSDEEGVAARREIGTALEGRVLDVPVGRENAWAQQFSDAANSAGESGDRSWERALAAVAGKIWRAK